ncbi:hypothetical protein DR190_18550 [Klebsiella pneumoniae]|nr:hypothetical protein DR190_18550 [Klebsiella pneumoniae]
MDPFSDILNLLSATSYTTAGLSTGNNWAMTFPGFHGFKFIVVRKGSFLFRLEDELTWKTLGVGEGVILTREGANKQVISSQADSLIKISRIWADFFPANTSNQPI